MNRSKAVRHRVESGWESCSDVELMERTRDGDDSAFSELFARHSHALVNFAYRMVGDRDRAEELAQDAFLQIFRARARYEPRSRFSTYLYRVATNLCLNELRRFEYRGKTERLDATVTDGNGERAWELPDEASASAEQHLAGLQMASVIQGALEMLPSNQRCALFLSRVDGFSYSDVAECLGTTESAVKSLVFRATQTLRRRLNGLLEAGQPPPLMQGLKQRGAGNRPIAPFSMAPERKPTVRRSLGSP